MKDDLPKVETLEDVLSVILEQKRLHLNDFHRMPNPNQYIYLIGQGKKAGYIQQIDTYTYNNRYDIPQIDSNTWILTISGKERAELVNTWRRPK